VGEIGYFFNIIFTYPIFNALMLLYHLFGDMGLSIVVLTIIIRLILFPLTLQQLKSMKATQALQPKMAEIRKKHAKDQQAQALAMQNLYKEYGVNPVAGCLPLLVQLPVLYGLFYALNNVFRLPGNLVTPEQKLHYINSLLYPFIPHFGTFPNIDLNWFTFLNPAWHFSLANADPTHVLPILAGVATFVSMRMSMPKNQPAAANDPSTQTAKTMQYMMPLITVIFGWTFAAGLALYWTVSSIFQAVQQYFVTGWGSLLTTPNFSKPVESSSGSSDGNRKTYSGDQRKERELVQQSEAAETKNGESEGPIARQLRTSPTSTRRRSSTGASARRRSSNSQRRKVSRS
jgi:YidC/Oxa1 family membrane protein insertase